MAYDPQRSHPRNPVADDETAPVDAILDEIADEAEADAAERAGMADVVEALVDEIVEDEAIIDVLATQPTAVGQRPDGAPSSRRRTALVAIVAVVIVAILVCVRRRRHRSADASP